MKEQINSIDKKMPILFDNKEDCCGCTSCYSICPVHAIRMQMDEEGFLYPHIDESKCICCHKCISVCAFKKDLRERGF